MANDLDQQEAKACAFFQSCPADPSTDQTHDRLTAFLSSNSSESGNLHRPVVIVTSGGTTVPLERRCVRFIDNFSAGTRGALSVEQFLRAGYAVIYLRRKGSAEPFTQGLPASSVLNLITQCLELSNPGASAGQPPHAIVGAQHASALTQSLLEATKALQSKPQSLLQIEFETIFEYLQLLKSVSEAVHPYGRHVLFYLAAAVSDFYVPWDKLEEHKIQSADGDLRLELSKVPKVLGLLVHRWAPGAVIVSFKLETDEHILVSKACGALSNYGVHAVIANLLHTRKDKVLLVTTRSTFQAVEQHREQSITETNTAPSLPRLPVDLYASNGKELLLSNAAGTDLLQGNSTDIAVTTIVRPASEAVIERLLVDQVVQLHSALKSTSC